MYVFFWFIIYFFFILVNFKCSNYVNIRKFLIDNSREKYELTDTERKRYLELIKETEFKTYTLEEIVEQLKSKKYDAFPGFIWMATHGKKYDKFEQISKFVQTRLLRWKFLL